MFTRLCLRRSIARPLGLELILPDWFYTGVLNRSLVLTIDRAYFDLTNRAAMS
jgi:plasmid replication initiation protein